MPVHFTADHHIISAERIVAMRYIVIFTASILVLVSGIFLSLYTGAADITAGNTREIGRLGTPEAVMTESVLEEVFEIDAFINECPFTSRPIITSYQLKG